jgi:hypothetical protein
MDVWFGRTSSIQERRGNIWRSTADIGRVLIEYDTGLRREVAWKPHPSLEVRGESDGIKLTSGAESVVSGELPHASKELSKTTAEASHANSGIGGMDATGLGVEEGKDEGG